jgi:UDP-glucose 6-dehydrogenase
LLAVDQGLVVVVVVDAFEMEAVERQLAINLSAVGVDHRVQLELLQLGLALGGDTLANDTKNLAVRAAVTSSHNSSAILSCFSSESPRRARLSVKRLRQRLHIRRP